MLSMAANHVFQKLPISFDLDPIGQLKWIVLATLITATLLYAASRAIRALSFLRTLPHCRIPRSIEGDVASISNDPVGYGQGRTAKDGAMYTIFIGLKPVVVLADQSSCEEFFAKSGDITRPQDGLGFGNLFDRYLGKSMGVALGDRWSTIRRSFQPAYRNSYSRRSLETLDQEIESWDQLILQPLAESGESMDLMTLSKRLSEYMIWSIFVGSDFVRQHKESFEYIADTADYLTNVAMGKGLVRFWFYQFLPTSTNKMLQDFYKEVYRITELYYVSQQKDGVLREVKREKMSKDEFFHTLVETMFANQDVMAPTVSWLLIHMMLYADTLPQLTEDHSGEDYKDELIAFVNESARMTPILAFSSQKALMDKSFHGIAPGASFAVNNFSVNRESKHWERPAEFDPSRFLPEKLKDIPPYAFSRFGMREFKCPGRHLTDMCLERILRFCVQKYNFCLENQEKYSHCDEIPTNPGKAFVAPDIKVFVSRKT